MSEYVAQILILMYVVACAAKHPKIRFKKNRYFVSKILGNTIVIKK